MRTFELCPQCGQKNLYTVHYGSKQCRNCDHFQPHGKHDLTLAVERYQDYGEPEIVLEIKVTHPLGPSDQYGDRHYAETQPITPDQLKAIADILISPDDRMLLQAHRLRQSCNCGDGYASLEKIRQCMVLDQLADI